MSEVSSHDADQKGGSKANRDQPCHVSVHEQCRRLRDEIERHHANAGSPIPQRSLCELLFDQSAIGIGMCLPDGTITQANQAFERISGYPCDQICGMNFRDLTHPEDVVKENKVVEELRRGGCDGTRYQKRYIRPDGEVVWVDLALTGVYSDSGALEYAVGLIQEITDLKEAERDLQETQRLYRAVAENFPHGALFLFDSDLKYVFVDGQELAEVGIRREDLIGKTVFEVFPPEIYEIAVPHARMIFQGESSYYEVHYRDRVYGNHAVPVRDGNGQVEYGLVIAQDISHLKRAELNARNHQAELQQVIDFLPSALLYTDAQRRIIKINPAFVELFGYEPAECLGRQTRFLYANERDYIELGCVRYNDQARSPRTPFEVEYRRKDGSVFVGEATSASVRDTNDKVQGYLGIIRDVTEERRTRDALAANERRLAEAERIACLGGWEWDVRTDELVFTDEWVRIHGVARNRMTMDELLPIAHPEDLPRIREAWQKAIDGVAPYDIQHRIIRQDTGEVRFVQAHGEVVFDEAGKAQLMFGIGQDVTEQKRAEDEIARYRDQLEELVEERTRELRQSQERLQRTERLASLGTLVSGLAHEINNPLGTILLACENALACQDRPDAEDMRTYWLNSILEDARRCNTIIQNVTQFSRSERSVKQVCSINEVIEDAIAMCRPLIARRNGTVEVQLAPELPSIRLNPREVEQAVTHLIRNALESTDAPVEVTISTRQTEGAIRFTVADNGSGIDDSHRPYIFDPFYTTRRHEGGMGLGLSIVHRVVTDHGGTVELVDSERGGATFAMTLPLTIDPEEAACNG